MAKAPPPKKGGHEAARERIKRAKQVFEIAAADTDVSFRYAPFGLPIGVRAEVRAQTGQSVDELLFAHGSVDVQTYADMWWISRLCDYETGADRKPITRAQVHAEWDERCAGVTKEDISDVLVEDGDDPKA